MTAGRHFLVVRPNGCSDQFAVKIGLSVYPFTVKSSSAARRLSVSVGSVEAQGTSSAFSAWNGFRESGVIADVVLNCAYPAEQTSSRSRGPWAVPRTGVSRRCPPRVPSGLRSAGTPSHWTPLASVSASP